MITMTDSSGGRRLPEPPGGPRRVVTPPPTPAQRQRQTGSFPAQAPQAESVLPREISDGIQTLLGIGFGRVSRAADDKIAVDGKVIGAYNKEERRAIIPYDATKGFRQIAIPPLMKKMEEDSRNAAEENRFVLFFEITAASIEICAGKKMGQKMLMNRIL